MSNDLRKVAGRPPVDVKELYPINIILGSRVKDKISGLEGIAVARVEYLNGNIQIAIQPKTSDSLTMPKSEYVDLIRIE
jgi:hypothetical protein